MTEKSKEKGDLEVTESFHLFYIVLPIHVKRAR